MTADGRNQGEQAPPPCPSCGAPLKFCAFNLMVPERRVYPGIACMVEWECPQCGSVFGQWPVEGAPFEAMPDDVRELRNRVYAARRSQSVADMKKPDAHR